jgi:hypothetical protein
MRNPVPYFERLSSLAPLLGPLTFWMLGAAAAYYGGCGAWWFGVEASRGRFARLLRLGALLLAAGACARAM